MNTLKDSLNKTIKQLQAGKIRVSVSLGNGSYYYTNNPIQVIKRINEIKYCLKRLNHLEINNEPLPIPVCHKISGTMIFPKIGRTQLKNCTSFIRETEFKQIQLNLFTGKH